MCDSCNALTINGVYCHERGCPDAWKDYKRTCKWCGSEFLPEYKIQEYCSQSCYNCGFGYPENELTDIDILPDDWN